MHYFLLSPLLSLLRVGSNGSPARISDAPKKYERERRRKKVREYTRTMAARACVRSYVSRFLFVFLACFLCIRLLTPTFRFSSTRRIRLSTRQLSKVRHNHVHVYEYNTYMFIDVFASWCTQTHIHALLPSSMCVVLLWMYHASFSLTPAVFHFTSRSDVVVVTTKQRFRYTKCESYDG